MLPSAAMADLMTGKWTLITGASSGFGEEFARQIAARGGHVLLTARSLDKLEALARELGGRGGVQARALRGDLAAEGGAAALVRAVDATGLPITHVINNAGFGSAGPFNDLPAEREAEMVRVNCEALTVISRHFLPQLCARGEGGIIHLASVASFQPTPYMATYAATKAFVLSLSLALAEESRKSGVKVMALCPGPVATGFQSAAGIGAIAGPMKMAAISSAETVSRALAAYAAGHDICVPGAVNKAITLGTSLLPRTLLARVAGSVMRLGGRR